MKLKRLFHSKNWPEQLIRSNLYDGNSLSDKQLPVHPLTLLAFKNDCVA